MGVNLNMSHTQINTQITTNDALMDEATEITEEIQNLDFEGLFPFQQVRLLVWEGLRKVKNEQA